MSATESAWARHTLLSSRRREFLGAPIHALTMAETLATIEEAIRLHRPLHHVVVNVATVVSMRQSAELHEDIAAADMVNVDGKGILWGARLCGVALPERVANYDVMINLFALCAERGYKPFLLGAEQHVLDAVATRLAKDYPSLVVAGRRNGYFKPEDEAGIVEAINASNADCLFVAMPTPNKERFLKRYRDKLKPSFVTGVGGGFDVYGGKVSRAPKFVQEAGLEWMFRLVQEPRRLWRRYYDTNTAYAGLLFREFRDRRMRRKVKD
ncbi:N-acetylglucosaminyldiphosphoundecaprenol N-acetyl-beta-D-mannosaminyltransferase [Mycolicibacterium aubagnense]